MCQWFGTFSIQIQIQVCVFLPETTEGLWLQGFLITRLFPPLIENVEQTVYNPCTRTPGKERYLKIFSLTILTPIPTPLKININKIKYNLELIKYKF
jgi:hypothetical protein